MYAVGIQGSPRKNGNTAYLLSSFLKALEDKGFKTDMFHAVDLRVAPCKEYNVCEKKGYCPLDDHMEEIVFPVFREAEIVVFAAPVFFYSVPSQMKMLIDRCQTLWARKYRLQLYDPKEQYRSGVLLAQGATKGKNLFDGIRLTINYTGDAIGAPLSHVLLYNRIEKAGEMKAHPTVLHDTEELASVLNQTYREKKQICFFSEDDAGAGPLAAVLTDLYSMGGVISNHAGNQPAAAITKEIERALSEEDRIDLSFRKPLAYEDIYGTRTPEIIVAINGVVLPNDIEPSAKIVRWELPMYDRSSSESFSSLKKKVEEKIKKLLTEIKNMV